MSSGAVNGSFYICILHETRVEHFSTLKTNLFTALIQVEESELPNLNSKIYSGFFFRTRRKQTVMTHG